MKRRPNGKGSVRPIKTGNRTKPWHAETPHVNVNGEKKRISLGYYETYEEAERVLNKWLRNRGTKDNFTLTELYDEWSERKYEEIRKSTADCYRAAWKQMADLYSLKVSVIRTGHFQTIIDVMKKSGMSYSSMHNVKVLASLLEDYAMQYDIIEKNYADFISVPKNDDEDKEKEVFTEEQIKTFEKLAKEGNLTAKIITILNYSGWRIGELLDLKVEDYNPKTNTFTGGKKTDAGKNRIVPVHSNIQEYIDEFLALNGPKLICRPVLKGRKPNQYEVLSSITPNYFRNHMFYPLLDELGFTDSKGEKFTPHITRHTFASACRKQGVDPVVVKRLMGHSKGNDITESVYTHVDLDMLVTAIKAIIFYQANKN